MKKKTILICGATGFIGRNVAEHFAKNSSFDVIGVYHQKPPFLH
jgi:nucleoside-diphosphate-sugar epimerase